MERLKIPAHSDFYPRSPCGERPSKLAKTSRTENISIHALLAESDCRTPPYNLMIQHISIHALLAESDDVIAVMTDAQSISIHALLAESDLTNYHFTLLFMISIHALLAESDSERCRMFDLFITFLSTLSLRRATQTVTEWA